MLNLFKNYMIDRDTAREIVIYCSFLYLLRVNHENNNNDDDGDERKSYVY